MRMPCFPALACGSSLSILCSYEHLLDLFIEFKLEIAIGQRLDIFQKKQAPCHAEV